MIKAKTGQPRASVIRTMNSNSDIAGGLYPSAVGQTDGELLAARVAVSVSTRGGPCARSPRPGGGTAAHQQRCA